MNNLTNEEKVLKYYFANVKLKELVRTGWINWKVSRDRLESVAEHIYGTEQLAIAMIKVYNYDIDYQKLVCMLTIHEIGEIVIGDIAFGSSVTPEEKKEREFAAVKEIVDYIGFDEILDLYIEFEERKTKEARFARWIDKLECDLMSKYYDEPGAVDLNDQSDNESAQVPIVQKYLSDKMSWSDMWMKIGQDIYGYDENFMSVSKYAMENGISRFKRYNK